MPSGAETVQEGIVRKGMASETTAAASNHRMNVVRHLRTKEIAALLELFVVLLRCRISRKPHHWRKHQASGNQRLEGMNYSYYTIP